MAHPRAFLFLRLQNLPAGVPYAKGKFLAQFGKEPAAFLAGIGAARTTKRSAPLVAARFIEYDPLLSFLYNKRRIFHSDLDPVFDGRHA